MIIWSDHVLLALFFPIERYSNYINKTMHTDNLLDLLPPEIISFILKYLPEQELKNSRSINNIWERETNLEWHKRMEFLFGRIVQGNYTVKEYYSKLKECNLSKDYPKCFLKIYSSEDYHLRMHLKFFWMG